ncbi:MAG: hypothetical protein RLZZ299_227 [Pseudomonadota bacterium]
MTTLLSLGFLSLPALAADGATPSAPPASAAPDTAAIVAPSGEPPARFSVAAEVGWQAVEDARWALFSRGDTLVTTGLRASWQVSPWLAAQASWGVGSSGLAFGETETLDGDLLVTDRPDDVFRSRFRAHVGTLGVRVAKPVVGPVELSATLEGAAMAAAVQFDDDALKDDNVGQALAKATAAGARVVFGVTAPFHVSRGRWVAPYLELGAGSFSELAFGEVGALGVAGSCGRFGISARF